MDDEFVMRMRLQQFAAYRSLCASVRKSGRENLVFALIMLGFAAYFFQNQFMAGGLVTVIVLLYVALAVGELLVGLYKMAFPSAEGVLFDAFLLLVFAGWNIGWTVLRVGAGMDPNYLAVGFGIYMLLGAVSRFKAYAQLRRLFRERPSREEMAWVNDLVREIREADPRDDDAAVDLPTRPHFKAKLLGRTAFFVSADDLVLIAAPEDFNVAAEPEDHGSGKRRALFTLHGNLYPQFRIDDASWANYQKWVAATRGPVSG